MKTRIPIIVVPGLVLVLAQTACQYGGDGRPGATMSAPVRPLISPMPQAAQTSGVMFYIKVVIDKKCNALAHLVGGMRDGAWERTEYDAASPWWKNPLIVYREAGFEDAQVMGRADAQVITGQGASGNVTVQVTLVPHAVVAMKAMAGSDGIRGTITTTISTAAEYDDGHRHWVK
jgi:hypothetical protein